MIINMAYKTKQLASSAEAAEEIACLSTADLVRLKEFAQLRSYGLITVEWTDLVNEAVSRVLSGTRRWPKDVSFIAFMAQTIRSVASEERRRVYRENVTLESDLAPPNGDAQNFSIDEIAASPMNLERELIARRTLEEILALFSDDHDALAILGGLGRGLSPEDVQRDAGMNQTQYGTTQRRIRRAIARAFSTKENQQ